LTKEERLLKIEELSTYFNLEEGVLKAVDGIDLSLKKGQVLGMVGESGCGKSVTAQSILRLVPSPGEVRGKIELYRRSATSLDEPIDLVQLNPSGKKIRSIRWKEIAMVFQEPMAAFSPIHTIEDQTTEPVLLHLTRDRKEAKEIVAELLSRVGISNPLERMREYPQQLSGGQKQRVMIAMALSCEPNLLIADEPTTALDVTVEAQILELLEELQADLGMSILYITHDLGVIAEIADEVAVMYLGNLVEFARVEDLFIHPLHPYTKALLRSIPRVDRKVGVRLDSIEGTVPVPIDLPQICPFYSRCRESMEGVCDAKEPGLEEVRKDHLVSCFLYQQEGLRRPNQE